jgi:hypothetical protein
MTSWDISPFEPEGLRVAPLRPPVLPEPERHGEDPANCDVCRARDEGIWFNERWRLARVTGVGVPLVLMLYSRDHYDMADLPVDPNTAPIKARVPVSHSAISRRCG